MSDSEDDQQYLDLIRRLVVENYCILASSALLWYDHFVSFDQEYQHIWQRKFSGASLLFFITRYSATFERITLVTSLFLVTNSDQACVPVLRLDDPLNDLSIFIVGAFAALRLYAIFGRNWQLLSFLIAFAIARVGISIYLQTHYTPIAFGPPLWGCGAAFDVSPNLYYRLNTATNALSLAADTLLLIFTWVKTVGIRRASYGVRGVQTPISTLLLRDGTLYFVLICAIQIFSIISIQIGSDFPLFAVWTYWNQSFTVIFLCRFILNLRGVHIASDGTLTEEPLSALDFASHVIGNLGAPLHLGPLEDETTSDMSEMTSATAHGGGVEEIEDKGEIVEVSRHPVGMSSTDRPPDVTDAARANETGSPPV